MVKDTRIAVYAGTFDPVTNGHVDIAKRAVRLFDRVQIGVADVGSSSKTPLFATTERVELLREALADEQGDFIVESFPGLLVDYVRKLGARVIIRGLRAVSDYEYEAQMAMTNRQIAPDIETVFLMTSERCSFITSSIVREVARYGGDVSKLVPPNVAEKIAAKYTKRNT